MKLPGPLGKWTAPQLVTLHDSRLGATFWFLRACVILYVLYSIFTSGTYNWSEIPGGLPTFWFEAGQLYKEQDNAQPYCNNDQYNYDYDEDEDGYWNDRDIGCLNLHYGEITTKSAGSGFVMTYMKEEDTRSRPCTKSQNPCASYQGWPSPTDRVSRNSSTRNPKSKSNGKTCTCATLKDYFVQSPEEIELHIEHAFWATQKMDVRGSSTYKEKPKEDADKKTQRVLIKTCLQKKDTPDGECHKEFEPGKRMALSIRDWMELAGVTLDERLTDVVPTDVKTGEFPYRRTVGLSLIIKLSYSGDVSQDTFTCYVEVDAQDGWTSIGSQVAYDDYESHEKMEFYDRYRRGVQFQFVAFGKITQFEYITLMNSIIQGLVLLGVCDTVVRIIACYALKESPVYANVLGENFRHKKALARFGVNAALASQAFKTWDTGKTKKITSQELLEVYKGNFDDELAKLFVQVVFDEAHSHGDATEGEGVTCEDLLHIIATGLVSIEELHKLNEKGGVKHSVKISPDGEA